MADIPQLPPGILQAVAQGRQTTPGDILSGGIPAGTQEAQPTQSSQSTQPQLSPQQTQSLQSGATDLSDSVKGYISSLPSTSGITQQNTEGTNLIAAGQIAAQTAIAKAKAKEIADNATAAAAFGFTPGASDGTIAKYSAAISDAENAVDAKRSEILGKQQLSFFDDPIQWMFNQVALPFDIAEFHTLNSTAAHKLDILTRMEQATQEAFKINAGVDQASAAAVVDGQNKVAAGQAMVAQAASGVQTAQLGLQATSVRLAGTKDAFDASIQAHQAWVADQNVAINAAQLDLNKQQLADSDARLLLEKDQAARQEQQATVQLALSNLSLGNEQIAAQGRNDLNIRLAKVAQVWKVQPVTIDQLRLMGDGPTRKFWENGIMDPAIQEGNAPALGYDATDALGKANAANAALTPAINYVRDKLITMRDNVIMPLQMTWKSLSPDTQHVMIQNAIQGDVKKEVNNIPDQGGIFSPGTLRSTLSIGQGEASLANTKIGAALSPAAKADPTLPTKASMIMDTAVQLIQGGKMTPAEAAGEINRIYGAVVQDNNEQRQYQEFRLNPLDPQVNGFKTSVQFGTGWGNKAPVNMLSPSAVEAVLTRAILQQRIQNNLGQGGVP